MNKPPPYLRGPIQLEWIRAAHKLGGPALVVGLAVWHHHRLKKCPEFPATKKALARHVGVGVCSVRRGLRALEGAGLIRLARRPGAASVITIPQKWRL